MSQTKGRVTELAVYHWPSATFVATQGQFIVLCVITRPSLPKNKVVY